MKRLEYWITRCNAAERFISESPCDPDTTENQLQAYKEWQELKNRKQF